MLYRISFYNDADVLTSVFVGSPRAADELVDQLNEKNPDAMAIRSEVADYAPKNKGEWIRFLNFAVAQQIDLGGAA